MVVYANLDLHVAFPFSQNGILKGLPFLLQRVGWEVGLFFLVIHCISFCFPEKNSMNAFPYFSFHSSSFKFAVGAEYFTC